MVQRLLLYELMNSTVLSGGFVSVFVVCSFESFTFLKRIVDTVNLFHYEAVSCPGFIRSLFISKYHFLAVSTIIDGGNDLFLSPIIWQEFILNLLLSFTMAVDIFIKTQIMLSTSYLNTCNFTLWTIKCKKSPKEVIWTAWISEGSKSRFFCSLRSHP